MGKKDEYNALRQEILISIQVVKNYRNMLYATVAATMAFAFGKGKAILFLVPFCVVLPIYFLARHQFDSILRIGAYINVFLEPGTDCQWETRLYEYDNLHKNKYSTKNMSTYSYVSISLCCLLLSMLYSDCKKIDVEFIVTLIAQVIAFFMCIYSFVIKKMDNLSVKEKYLREWREIQRNEIQNRQREEKKLKGFIKQIYNQAKRGQFIGTIYDGKETIRFSDIKNIDVFTENRNPEKIHLKSKLANTEVDINKWELDDYEINTSENKIFIRLKNEMEVELKY